MSIKAKEKPIEAEFVPTEEKEDKKLTLFERGKAIGKTLVEKGKAGGAKAIHYVAENAPWLVPVIITGGSFLLGGIELFSGKQPATFDPRTKEWLNLDHNMINDEIVEANRIMREEGVTKAEALNEMGLLKEEKKRKK